MFRPESMRHVLIQVVKNDLPQAALTLAAQGSFAPDRRPSDEHELVEVPGERYRQLYRQAESRLSKINSHFQKPVEVSGLEPRLVSERELDALNKRLGSLWQECSKCQEDFRRLDDEIRLVDQLESALETFANLNIDLGLLQGDKEFLDLRLGIVPSINLERMRDALGLADYLVYTFLKADESIHVVVVGPKDEQTAEVDAVLESAGFRDLPVPAELRDEPNKIRQELTERRREIGRQRAEIEQRVEQRAAQSQAFLQLAVEALTLAEPYVQLDSSARGSTYLAVISGWVPARELAQIEAALHNDLEHPFLLTARRPQADERHEVPTLLRPSRLMAPFTTLVRQYGIPRYGEIDPSSVFAVTFILMYGMMFGDVGHGAVIAAVALWLRDKLGRFTTFAVIAGLSSMVFGFVYGSIFGYEHVLHPLWISPLSDPILMLQVALAWGIGFLLLMTALSIYNHLIAGDVTNALLGHQSLVSLMLYVGLLSGAYGLSTGAGFGWLPGLLVLGSLAAITVHTWQHSTAPPGERVMVVIMESYEAIMSSVSGTLSFLRVAAFSLNHAALAVAVFTLAEMMDTTGHWIMVILGNLFILVLEGAIVAIQVLRLEYYEGFSRFYSGDGKEFEPLRLRIEPQAQASASVNDQALTTPG